MKSKKILVTLSLLSTMVLSGVATVSAADSEGTSEGAISFKPNEGPTTPVDPENPSNPEDPNNPAEPLPNPENPDNPNRPTDNLGPLSLDVVPGTMNFGNNQVDLGEKTYMSVANPGTLHYLQITDNRGTQVQGWNVSVSRTEFMDGTKVLGSQLMLPADRTVRSKHITPPTDPAPDFVTSMGKFEIPVGAANAATLLSTGVGVADQLHGKEQTTYTWSAEEEELIVGVGQAKTGNFTSTITWSLNAGPAN